MVAAELTLGTRPRPMLDVGLWVAYLTAAAVIAATTALCLLIPDIAHAIHQATGVSLSRRLQPAAAPTVGGAGRILLANLRSTAWPLLMLAAGLHRLPGLRRAVDVGVSLSLAVNLLPVGAALSVYRTALLPYLPHLPFELWAIATGPACWYLASRGRLRGRRLALAVLLLVGALLIAAGLETWAVPHH